MSTANDQIYVKSHVARDLLQNAGLFKTDKLVVWEYVSNGLQYVNPGTNPIVRVQLDSKNKKIVIVDNGRGMDWAGLQNFFVMHGENIDRKEGRPGRGRFGTGKSAAFGIASSLRITTVRSRKRSTVELNRSDIEKMTSEDPIPVRKVEREVPTNQENGTIVEIEGVHLRSLDQAGIIHYIERHLAHWPKNAAVFVNNHECEFQEPPIKEEKKFRAEGAEKGVLGDVVLVIKVSKAPLEQDLRGISIFCNGVWHETTLAGSENKEMAQYIFGEFEVPKLDDDKSPIAPFDVSRSMRLNPENETVRALYAFIGQKVEMVRRALAEEDRKRKSEEEVKRLTQQAAEIARVINEDFDAFRQQVAKVRAKTSGGIDAYRLGGNGGGENGDILFGNELPAEIVCPPVHGDGPVSPGPPRPPVVTLADPTAEKLGRPAGGAGGRRPQGGFRVQFKPMGAESHRALYEKDDRTIYINLEHPQLVAAIGVGDIDDPVFRRLAYEVAFSEYAIALASELEGSGHYIDPSDPIVDIRLTLNRVARKAASLYSEQSLL
jgi:Histidine kinase-, DNA gyrase B-, and HSP90-like ATPase